MIRPTLFLFVISLFVLPYATCQEFAPGNVGFVRVVNALGVSTPTYIQVGSLRLLGGEAVPAGETSGNLSLVAGSHTLRVRNKGCDPQEFSETFTIAGGSTIALVVYAGMKERDGKLVAQIECDEFSESMMRNEVQLSVVSISSKPMVSVKVGSGTLQLEPRKPQRVDVDGGEVIGVEVPGQEADTIELSDKGHFVMFVFDDAKTGKFGYSVLAHVRVEADLPRSLRKQAEETSAQSPTDSESSVSVPQP